MGSSIHQCKEQLVSMPAIILMGINTQTSKLSFKGLNYNQGSYMVSRHERSTKLRNQHIVFLQGNSPAQKLSDQGLGETRVGFQLIEHILVTLGKLTNAYFPLLHMGIKGKKDNPFKALSTTTDTQETFKKSSALLYSYPKT